MFMMKCGDETIQMVEGVKFLCRDSRRGVEKGREYGMLSVFSEGDHNTFRETFESAIGGIFGLIELIPFR
jgi:hypothetical protein